MTITKSIEKPTLYKLSEVAAKNGKDSHEIWIVIKDSVYDVTKFTEVHPGGSELILEYAGRDCTKDFNDVGHSIDAMKDLKALKIGELIDVSLNSMIYMNNLLFFPSNIQEDKMNSRSKSSIISNEAKADKSKTTKKRRGFIMFC